MISKWIGLAAASLAISLTAPAETEEACPSNVEQSLYNLSLMVKAGQEKDPVKIFGWARQAIEKCPDRGAAQGLATRLIMVIYPAAQSYEDKNTILTLALQGVSQNDYAWRPDAVAVEVKRPDGEMETLYPYGNLSALLEEEIIPKVFQTAAEGHPAEAFTATTLAQCPYKSDKQSRAEREAKSLLNHVLTRSFSKADIAFVRLDALGNACEHQAGNMLHAKADLTYQIARRNLRNAVQAMFGGYRTGTEQEAFDELAQAVEAYKASKAPMQAYIQYVRSSAEDGDKDKRRDFDSRFSQMDRWLERYAYYETCMSERSSFMRSVDPCPDLSEP